VPAEQPRAARAAPRLEEAVEERGRALLVGEEGAQAGAERGGEDVGGQALQQRPGAFIARTIGTGQPS
jgi:hypothetical protein